MLTYCPAFYFLWRNRAAARQQNFRNLTAVLACGAGRAQTYSLQIQSQLPSRLCRGTSEPCSTEYGRPSRLVGIALTRLQPSGRIARPQVRRLLFEHSREIETQFLGRGRPLPRWRAFHSSGSTLSCRRWRPGWSTDRNDRRPQGLFLPIRRSQEQRDQVHRDFQWCAASPAAQVTRVAFVFRTEFFAVGAFDRDGDWRRIARAMRAALVGVV